MMTKRNISLSLLSVVFLFGIGGFLGHATSQYYPKRQFDDLVEFLNFKIGFKTEADVGTFKSACKKNGGRIDQIDEVYEMIYICDFPSQKIIEKRIPSGIRSMKFLRPKEVSFGFDSLTHETKYAMFVWNFDTWAKSEETKLFLITQLKDMFPLGIRKVEHGIYKLRNTNFYLSTYTKTLEDTTDVNLVVIISTNAYYR